MANVKWVGGAAATAESRVWTVAGTWANTETVSVAVGGRKITITLGATAAASVTAVANAIVAAFNGAAVTTDEIRDNVGSSFLEMSEITAANVAGVITFTHDTAGVEFSVTLTETSTSGTVSAGTVTTATGPNSWSTPSNWSGGTVPVNSDVVYIDDGSIDILYGLDQSAVSLTELHITANYTGNIGLDSIRDRGEAATEYAEYRRLALKIGGTPTVHIGQGDGAGSPRLRIEVGSSAATFRIYDTGDSDVDGHPAVFISGGNSAGAEVYGGTVWFGAEGGNSLGFTGVTVAGSEDSTPDVVIGVGGSGTATTIKVSRATATVDCAAGSISAHAGAIVRLIPAYSTGNVYCLGGNVVPVGVAKSLAIVIVTDGGHFDAGEMSTGVSVSSAFTCYAGATVTFPEGCSIPNITLAAGVGIAGTVVSTSVATLNLPIRHSSDILFTGF